MPLSKKEWLDLIPNAPAKLLVELAAEHHVKTEAGVKWFDQPLGSLIVAKAGHKLVYLGGLPYQVPKDAKVYVPDSVDIHNDAQLDESAKMVAHDGQLWVLKPGVGDKPAEVNDLPQGWVPHADWVQGQKNIDQGGNLETWAQAHMKEVPDSYLKKPVYQGGKLAGWVPQDYKVYQVAKTQPGQGTALWIKGDGKWFAMAAGALHPYGEQAWAAKDNWVKEGLLIEQPPPGGYVLPQGVHPPTGEASEPVPATILVPAAPIKHPGQLGTEIPPAIKATKDDFSAAISVLQAAKSTNVKAPLKAAGNVLAGMDYQSIAKQQLKAHPELHVAPGTKAHHVGQVKTAILHWLGEYQEALAKSEAQAQQAAEAKQKAEDEAEHAQALTPATAVLTGTGPTTITVNKDDLAHVIHNLGQYYGSHGSLKALLKGTALEKVDYLALAAAHKKKSKHKENTKTAFLHHLQWTLDALTAADQGSGHDVAAELDQIISKHLDAKIGLHDAHSAIAVALLLSAKYKQPFIAQDSIHGVWSVTKTVPDDSKGYWEVTLQHHVIAHYTSGKVEQLSTNQVLDIAKEQFEGGPPAVVKTPGPQLEPPQWMSQKIPELVEKELAGPPGFKLPHKLAYALKNSTGKGYYVYQQVPGQWMVNPPVAAHTWSKYKPAYYVEDGVVKQVTSDTTVADHVLSQDEIVELLSGLVPLDLGGAATEPPVLIKKDIAEGVPVNVYAEEDEAWAKGLPGWDQVKPAKVMAQEDGKAVYVIKGPADWTVSGSKPMGSDTEAGWWEVNPYATTTVVYHPPPVGIPLLPADVQDLIDNGNPVDATPGKQEWVKQLPGGDQVKSALTTAKDAQGHIYIVRALEAASLLATGPWMLATHVPTPEQKNKGWWDVTPGGSVTYWPPVGSQDTGEAIQAPGEPPPIPEPETPTAKGIPVTVGQVAKGWVPPGSMLYYKKGYPTGDKWVKFPDGHWFKVGEDGLHKAFLDDYSQSVSSGDLVPYVPTGAPATTVQEVKEWWAAHPEGAYLESTVHIGDKEFTVAEAKEAIDILANSPTSLVLPTLKEAGNALGTTTGIWSAFKIWPGGKVGQSLKEQFIEWVQEELDKQASVAKQPNDLTNTAEEDLPPGTTVYGLSTAEGPNYNGPKWIKNPSGGWLGKAASKPDFTSLPWPDEQGAGYVKEGTLKPLYIVGGGAVSEDIPIVVGDTVAGMAASGSKVYVSKLTGTPNHGSAADAKKYVQFPDGTWAATYLGIEGYKLKQSASFGNLVDAGQIIPIQQAYDSEKPLAEVLKEAAEIPVWVDGKQVAVVPAGSKFYTGHQALDPATAVKYVKFPDGSWKLYTATEVKDEPDAETMLAEDVLKAVPMGMEAPGQPPGQAEFVTKAKAMWGTGKFKTAGADVLANKLAKALAIHDQYADQWVIPSTATKGKWTLAFTQSKGLDALAKGQTIYHIHNIAFGPPEVSVLKADHSEGLTPDEIIGVLNGKGEPQTAAPIVPEGPEIPVVYKGVYYGTVPAGSTLYTKPGAEGQSNEKHRVWIHLPDDNWKYTVLSGSKASLTNGSTWDHFDEKVTSGEFKELPPASEAEVTQAKALADFKESLFNASAEISPPPKEDMVAGATTWQQAAAQALTNTFTGGAATWYGQNKVFAFKPPKSTVWLATNYPTYIPAGSDVYRIDKGEPDLPIAHIKAAGEMGAISKEGTAVPFSGQLQEISKYLIPSAIALKVGDDEPLKVFKYGYYHKKGSKALLQIGAGGSTFYASKYGFAVSAVYTYHKPDGGVDEKSPKVAANWLANAQYVGTTVKESADAGIAVPLSYTNMAKAGYWTLAASTDMEKWLKFAIKDDGSGLRYLLDGTVLAISPDQVKTLVATGDVLDGFGNTIIEPGTEPAGYHIFGSKKLTKPELEALQAAIQSHYADSKAIAADIIAVVPVTETPGPHHLLWAQFWQAHSSPGWMGQRDGVLGLIDELLYAPKYGTPPLSSEPVYLKAKPPGITGPKDIFEFNQQGYAHPFDGQWFTNVYAASSAELRDQIKEVSAQFGGSKVVGLHPAGLNVEEKRAWVEAFRAGDMAKVFALDAKSGKVSPAHPGAPSSPDTHKIIWAPWDEGQVPATVDVEGDWTDLDIDIPKAEVANYLIKAGFSHAEFLTNAQRRAVVLAHRKHDQETVDTYSRLAAKLRADGATPVSEVPAWTDDIKPAKSYDVNFENKDPAISWTNKATDDFVKDHVAELTPFAEQHGMSASQIPETTYSSKRMYIQEYLDELAAKEEAERLRPKYHLVTGATPPVGSDAMLVEDQFHKQYVFWQPSAEDGNRQIAAYTMARLWGYKDPPAMPITLEAEGIPGIGQQYLPASETLTEDKITSLTPQQAGDLAAEHVLDWALDNPDTHPGQYLLRPDGSLVGIDKSRAFAGKLGEWDGLGKGIDSFAVSAPGLLYQAIRDGKVSKEVAGTAYVAAMRAAYRMELLPDSQLITVLSPAVGDIQAVVDRKNSLEADVGKMWAGIFKAAGLKLPPVPKERLTHGLHSGFLEPTYFDHAIASKSYGAPAFFAGTELEDGHLLTWTELAGENRLLRGEGHVLGTGNTGPLGKVMAWVKDHVSGQEKLHNGFGGDYEDDEDYEPPPPPPSNDKGDVKGEQSWWDSVLSGVKAVSRVNEHGGWSKEGELYSPGGYTAKQISYYEDAKKAMQQRRQAAETAVAKGDDSKEWAAFTGQYGADPDVQLLALQYYQGIVDLIEESKGNGHVFQKGEVERWVPPPPKPKPEKPAPPKPKPVVDHVKVMLTGAVRELGSIHITDHELHLSGKTHPYKGNVYKVTLPTGEVIEVNDSAGTHTPPGEVGRIRFRANAKEGAASLERIRVQLQAMGLELPEATPTDMELLYWRILTHTLAGRPDFNSLKYKKVFGSLKAYADDHHMEAVSPTSQAMAAKLISQISGALDPADELELWHDAWGKIVGPEVIQEWVDKQRYLPHLGHFDPTNPEVTGGKPWWYRVEAAPRAKEIDKEWGFLNHSNYQPGDYNGVIHSGSLASTEARLRALGIWKSGTSSPEDITKGGGGVVFMHPPSDYAGNDYLISPRVLARTATYGSDHDFYGSLADRKTQSKFDLDGSRHHGSQDVAKDMLSMLDDLEVIKVAPGDRDGLIKYLKDHGITTIRGLPVEDRIVIPNQYDGAKARDVLIAQGDSWLDPPEKPYVAPPSGIIAHALITTPEAEEAAEEAGEEALEAAKEQLAGKVVYAPSAEGAPKPASQAAVKEVFTGGKSQTPDQVKHDVAERLAAVMPEGDSEALKQLLDDPAVNLYTESHWGDTKEAMAIAGLIKTWSQGNSAPITLALQDLAYDTFGMSKEALPPLGYAGPDQLEEAKKLIAKYGPVLTDFLQAMWGLSQADLGEAGIQDVTLYRILYFENLPAWAKDLTAGQVIDAPKARPIASYAYTQGGATGAGVFTAGPHHVLIKTVVPRQLVLSFPRTGFGAYPEHEFTVLDSSGQWEVVNVQ